MKISAIASLLLLLLSFGQNAFAIDCGQKSPTYSSLGERYFGFSAVPEMTAKEEKILDDFVESLYGKWIFEIEEVICDRADESPQRTLLKGDGEAVITANGPFPLVIQMTKEFKDFAQLETLKLLAMDAAYGFTLSKTQIDAAQFRRIRNGGRRPLHEYDYRISKSKEKLKLDISMYISGRFHSGKKVTFRRR